MPNVLDNNHGIEIINYGSSKTYLPWYRKLVSDSRPGYMPSYYYYTRIGGWQRVEYDTYEAAYNHIARSRRMPTSKDVHSTYHREMAVPSNG